MEVIYYLTKSLDATRPVISNDGWEYTKSDIITLHDYAGYEGDFPGHWTDWEQNLSNAQSFNGERYVLAGGFRYERQPIIPSEFGGIVFYKDEKAWGYGNVETSEGSYLERLNSLTDAIYSMDFINGYCHAQLIDVEQEQDGYTDTDGRDKVGAEKVRTATQGGRK